MVKETFNAKETFEAGYEMGKKALPGQIYCLNGDLGVGKTVFTQGFAKGLGIEEPVNSPTFTIIQEYHEGRLPLYHFDVYRIGDVEEMDEVGFDEIKKKVEEAAKILDLEKLLDRKPKALSGGQRQRVAMGRAIVRNPKVFLMDEPLSNLDAKLRVQMRSEISSLHNRLGATIIYVTHDQTEAMTLGTRIVVLKDGVIMQVDSPQKLYNQPNNLFVAGFIGSPQMNFVDAQCVVEGAKAFLKFDKYQVELPEAKAKKLIDGGYAGKNVVFGIRPEDIYDSAEHLDKFATCKIDSDVTGYELLGAEVLLYFTVAGANMSARVDSDTTARYGDHIELAFDPHKIHVFDKETELTITN